MFGVFKYIDSVDIRKYGLGVQDPELVVEFSSALFMGGLINCCAAPAAAAAASMGSYS